mmetsp:Transcript_22596/g.25234  ORF Transcript_22596/g.25234 Transcript_22596/m.25234 type:complete len:177 (-) Transcript_22596:95-625(-)
MNTFNPYYLTIFALFVIIGGSIISAETVLNKSVSSQHLRSSHNRPIIATKQKKFEQQQKIIADLENYNSNNSIKRILEDNGNVNNDNDNAAYTVTETETDTDTNTDTNTNTDTDTEPDKKDDTSFAYDHSDGSSTIKFNDKEFVISDDSEEWQWWVWAMLVLAGMVLLCCLCKCFC